MVLLERGEICLPRPDLRGKDEGERTLSVGACWCREWDLATLRVSGSTREWHLLRSAWSERAGVRFGALLVGA